MTSNSSPTDPVSSSTGPAEAAPSTAPSGTPAQGSAGAGAGYTTSTTVSSLQELQKKAPKVYDAILQGIAMNICNEMKQHQDELKRIMDEERRNSGQA